MTSQPSERAKRLLEEIYASPWGVDGRQRAIQRHLDEHARQIVCDLMIWAQNNMHPGENHIEVVCNSYMKEVLEPSAEIGAESRQDDAGPDTGVAPGASDRPQPNPEEAASVVRVSLGEWAKYLRSGAFLNLPTERSLPILQAREDWLRSEGHTAGHLEAMAEIGDPDLVDITSPKVREAIAEELDDIVSYLMSDPSKWCSADKKDQREWARLNATSIVHALKKLEEA